MSAAWAEDYDEEMIAVMRGWVSFVYTDKLHGLFIAGRDPERRPGIMAALIGGDITAALTVAGDEPCGCGKCFGITPIPDESGVVRLR